MIKIENVEVVGWEHAIRGMRNPKNSWEKSDSGLYHICSHRCGAEIGDNDHKLMMNLRNAGTDHRKYMRMITVYLDVTAPLYWWKEYDTYKVGTVANSCSTMHKIHDKEFTREDFSHDRLLPDLAFDIVDFNEVPLLTIGPCPEDPDSQVYTPRGVLQIIIDMLNICREKYLETKDKKYWWQMIQLLPSSYNQRRALMVNYEVLANMYKSRKNHKLDEWVNFCKWIESLPYSELITGEVKDV